MKCPECGYITFDDLDRCKRCHAVWVARPAGSGADKLTPSIAESGEPPALEEERSGTAALELRLDEEFDRLYERLQREEGREHEIRRGGFFRRSCAFLVDLVVLFFFSSLLFYFTYVGYRVGMAAHQQSISFDNWDFLRLLSFAWLLLVTGYFVLFHGSGGQTVGKWVLGLRVVDADGGAITYGQALVRWLGLLLFAPIGLGFLWVLWDREKKGWHDILAHTRVVREWIPTSGKD